MANDNFLDRPLGDYDNRAGATQFPDGDYAGTVTDIKSAEKSFNDKMKRVTVTVNIDDLGPVVRTMNVSWADNTPWTDFAHAIFGNDPDIKSRTPRAYMNRRVLTSLKWGGSYMDITRFATVSAPAPTGTHAAHAGPSPAENNRQTTVVATPATSAIQANSGGYVDPRRGLEPRPRHDHLQLNQRGERPVAQPARTLAAVPSDLSYPSPGNFTPGQRRVLMRANEWGLPWARVEMIVQDVAGCTIEGVEDSAVAKVIAAFAQTQSKSA